jgi:hypothetical protein
MPCVLLKHIPNSEHHVSNIDPDYRTSQLTAIGLAKVFCIYMFYDVLQQKMYCICTISSYTLHEMPRFRNPQISYFQISILSISKNACTCCLQCHRLFIACHQREHTRITRLTLRSNTRRRVTLPKSDRILSHSTRRYHQERWKLNIHR